MKKFYLIFIIFLCFNFNSCYVTKLSANILVAKRLDNPIIVDFVFVFDQAVLDDLQKVSSAQWFAKRAQYKLDLELNEKIEILSYELVPGQRMGIKDFRPKHKNIALIIYASYLTPGDHRVILKEYSNIGLGLGKEDFAIRVYD